jgi:heme O synthase-like polyprenyltransferase
VTALQALLAAIVVIAVAVVGVAGLAGPWWACIAAAVLGAVVIVLAYDPALGKGRRGRRGGP